MKKTVNQETGETTFSFPADEIKKLKTALIAGAAIFLISVGAGLYSAFAMNSLKSENELYKNQLKMAEEKMDALNDKLQTVENLSSQLQDMIKAGSATPSGEAGIGGASTVPDIAVKKDGKDGKKDISTPGQLLSAMRKMDERLDAQIKTMLVLREKLINQTYGVQVSLTHASSTTPDMWPVKGTISSEYGFRNSPGGFGSTYHEGIDIAVSYGAPIEATASGVVTQAGWMDGYGYLVEIKHSGGIVTRYGHNSAILVNVGQKVDQGAIVALAGSTGNSTGPHCHYEVRINGTSVDPLYFLPNT